MSKLDRLARNWRKRDFWTDEALPYLRRLPQTAIFRLYSRVVHGEPVHVVDEDWDTLIILDACRYDTFAETNWFDGELEAKISKGCVTGNFLRGNFSGEYPEIVYIAGNPHGPKIVPDKFHAFVPACETHWDEELQTVPPEAMSTLLRETAEEYPNKRIVAHYLQPHGPYIGPKARERYGGGPSPEDLLREGKIAREEMLEIYTENLELALRSIDEIRDELVGKTVLTSDHGEMFDDVARPFRKRVVGHWPRMRTTELVKVPWFTLPFDERKDITAGEIQTAATESDAERNEKLRALGYLE